MKEFDENEVVRRIRMALPEDKANLYSGDDLLNVVDMIWDYYEINGLLDIDMTEDDDVDDASDIVSDLKDYCIRMLRKDKLCKIMEEDVESIVKAELDYEDYLESD